MDTRTGEIFKRTDAGQLAADEYESKREFDRARQRMAEAEARRELVPVSDRVAMLMQSAQKSEAKAKRKAAKAARKRNR